MYQLTLEAITLQTETITPLIKAVSELNNGSLSTTEAEALVYLSEGTPLELLYDMTDSGDKTKTYKTMSVCEYFVYSLTIHSMGFARLNTYHVVPESDYIQVQQFNGMKARVRELQTANYDRVQLEAQNNVDEMELFAHNQMKDA